MDEDTALKAAAGNTVTGSIPVPSALIAKRKTMGAVLLRRLQLRRRLTDVDVIGGFNHNHACQLE